MAFELTSYVGVDLGTSRTRIWLKGAGDDGEGHDGLVIDQPTALAINTKNGKVVAVGQEAAEMSGRMAAQIEVKYPIQHGKIYDQQLARALLQVWLQEVLGWRYVFSPVVMVSVPADSTQANRQAVTELFYELGAREVFTIAQPLAAAIGAGVPIADASGTMVCHLGAGVVEAGLISLGSLVEVVSNQQAGNDFDILIQAAVAKKHQLEISLETARKLKHNLLLMRSSEQTMPIVGKSQENGKPQEAVVSAAELLKPVQKILKVYQDLVAELFAKAPPELAEDVMDKGMLVTGGLAQLVEFDAWLTTQLAVPAAVIDEPDLAVIKGIGTALTHLNEFKRSINYG